jgi:hypothetical protein
MSGPPTVEHRPVAETTTALTPLAGIPPTPVTCTSAWVPPTGNPPAQVSRTRSGAIGTKRADHRERGTDDQQHCAQGGHPRDSSPARVPA